MNSIYERTSADGFVLGIGAGTLNIIVKTVVVMTGHEDFPCYSIVWTTQSALAAYFCAVAFAAARRENK